MNKKYFYNRMLYRMHTWQIQIRTQKPLSSGYVITISDPVFELAYFVWMQLQYHWQIQGGVLGTSASRSISFIFMQFSGKILPNIKFSLAPRPCRELLDAPLSMNEVSPESAIVPVCSHAPVDPRSSVYTSRRTSASVLRISQADHRAGSDTLLSRSAASPDSPCVVPAVCLRLEASRFSPEKSRWTLIIKPLKKARRQIDLHVWHFYHPQQ